MSDLVIGDDLAAKINSSLADGLPILIAYVNGENQARLSFRGSAHVHSSDQLALWARNPEGGLLANIAANPKVTLLYRDPASRTMVFFYGRASVADDEATRNAVYDASPEPERNADPDKKGSAVIIDLDQVQGRNAEGPINLTR